MAGGAPWGPPSLTAVQWRVEHRLGPAGEHLGGPEPEGRTIRVLEVTRPALVLGSAQPLSDVDQAGAARLGVEVLRRRSGGGAVLLVPGEAIWLEVCVPGGDPLWSADVGRAFHWLGRAWAAALRDLGLAAGFHDGPMRHNPWSRRVCFAGVGHGEVFIDGRKVVGLSQRRTRSASLFQCCALLHWDPDALVGLLALSEEERETLAGALAHAAVGIGLAHGHQLRATVLDVLAGF